MTGIKPPHDFAFFCDESSFSQDRFTVVGGVCVQCSSIDKIHQNMHAYREEHNMRAELKWTKVSNQKALEYTALADYFFAMNNVGQMHFHSLIFDNTTWNNSRVKGFKDGGISRLYYQLILHKFAKIYGRNNRLFVCLDHRNSNTSLHDLRSMLNNACVRDHNVPSPIKELVSADSKDEVMLQINDVILGAVAAVRNGKHLLASTRKAKRELASLVLEKSGVQSFEQNTPRNATRFTVWNFQSSKNI